VTQQTTLLELTVVTDDDTGCYRVGEIDFSLHTAACDEWLSRDGARAEAVRTLRWLADQVEGGAPPIRATGGESGTMSAKAT